MEKGKLTFKQLQNWFGDRGHELEIDDMETFGNDDRYIYWIPTNKNNNMFHSHEDVPNTGKTVMWVPYKTLFVEIEDEVCLTKSPYRFE